MKSWGGAKFKLRVSFPFVCFRSTSCRFIWVLACGVTFKVSIFLRSLNSVLLTLVAGVGLVSRTGLWVITKVAWLDLTSCSMMLCFCVSG